MVEEPVTQKLEKAEDESEKAESESSLSISGPIHKEDSVQEIKNDSLEETLVNQQSSDQTTSDQSQNQTATDQQSQEKALPAQSAAASTTEARGSKLLSECF